MVAIGKGRIPPTVQVAEPMVVSAQGREVVDGGRTSLGEGNPMVEVAVRGRHSTAGEDTGGVLCDHGPVLGGGGSPTGDPTRHGGPGRRVCHGVRPRPVPTVGGNSTGDVGDHWAEPGELGGGLCQVGKGLEVDAKLDGRGRVRGSLSFEDVEEHIGPELVHGPGVAAPPETQCALVDPSLDPDKTIR